MVFCKIIVHHDFARKFCSRGKAGKNVPFVQNYDAFKVEKVLEKKIQVYDDKKKVEFFSTKSLQNLFLGLPIHSHTFSKFVHANSEYVQKLTKVFAKSMYPMKETQPHKSLLFVFFFLAQKNLCQISTLFTHNNNKDKNTFCA